MNLNTAAKHKTKHQVEAAGGGSLVEDRASRGVPARPVDAPACCGTRGRLRTVPSRAARRRQADKLPGSATERRFRLGHISALRCFFTDLLLWELVPYRFDPKQTFRYPRSLALLRSPNPRIIAEDVWAKLLWAGLNLETSDLPLSKNALGQAAVPRYPVAMMRALALVWLFAGLRKD